ncbi:MAG: DUF4358 domain-containing protein [Oscillospiraceae bacterium]|nr:DUF4358 domain-containing protein [Oscillospiraceae bacterium]
MSLNQIKIPLLEAAKWVSVILLLVFMFFQLSSLRTSSTDFDTMKEAVLASADLTPMVEADAQSLKRLYGLDGNDFEGVMLYYPTTNMGAEEILLVKLTATSQQEAVKTAMETRIANQMNSFDGYGITQYEMLEKAVVEVQGNYLLMVVAENPAPVRQAFLDAL